MVPLNGPLFDVGPSSVSPSGSLSFVRTLTVTGAPCVDALSGCVTGGRLLVIVTVKLAGVATLPAWSVAVQVSVVVPTGKFEPELKPVVGDDVHVTASVPSTLSVAVTEKVTGALVPLLICT